MHLAPQDATPARAREIRTRSVRDCAYRACMAIARFPSIVIDCPDPGALATFYGAMLDWKVEISSDWADVRADYGQCISFQQVQGYTPPRWPARRCLSRCIST